MLGFFAYAAQHVVAVFGYESTKEELPDHEDHQFEEVGGWKIPFLDQTFL